MKLIVRSAGAIALVYFIASAACVAAAPESSAEAPAELGAALVQSHGCAGCHEDSPPGSPILAGRLEPLPGTHVFGPNLTPDPDTGLGEWSDVAVRRALREGTDDEGHPLCATMPRFASLSENDMTALIAYLRSLQPVHREVPESECAGP